MTSISSVSSDPWSRFPIGDVRSRASGGPAASAVPNGGGQNGAAPNAAGAASLFQRLSGDIQAMLVQAGGAAPAASANTQSPEQDLASTFQSLITQLQEGAMGQPSVTSTGTSQTASADPTAAPDGGRPHHHHHHHSDGGGPASATASSATALNLSGTSAQTPAGSPVGSDQSASTAIASEIIRAFQGYAGAAITAVPPGLVA